MQALPPAGTFACIEIANANLANVRIQITVSGRSDEVGSWLQNLSEKSSWQTDVDRRVGSERSVTLTGPTAVPWGEVGRLRYEARSRGLAITFSSLPAICEFKYR